MSYFEWKQNMKDEKWTLEEVDSRLKDVMVKAFSDVSSAVDQHSTDFRTGAYAVAIERLQDAIMCKIGEDAEACTRCSV